MAEFNQFGSMRPTQSADGKQCAHFESMLTDAVDGTLTAEEQAAFELHLVGCAVCSEMLASAKRGAAWLEMLREHAPEPPAAMIEKILAQTSGTQTLRATIGSTELASGAELALAGAAEPRTGGLGKDNVIPFVRRMLPRFDFRAAAHTLLQPRLAMTAAMAFFSIALTLNLTGIRLSEFRASDLKPSSLRRSIYEANAHVVRYYTNLRVVYELESRVHDLQRSSDDDSSSPPPQPQPADGAAGQGGAEPAGGKKGQEKDSPAKRRVSPGTSRREPMPDGRRVIGVLAESRSGPLDRWTTDPSELVALNVELKLQERGTV